MNSRLVFIAQLSVGAAVVLGLASCQDHGSASFPVLSLGQPLQPSPPPAPAPPGAQAVGVDEPFAGVLHGTDPPCDEFKDPMEPDDAPCEAFQVTPPSAGYVTIRLSQQNPAMALCASYPVTGKYWTGCSSIRPPEMPVVGGVAYAFGVSFTTWDGSRVSRGDTLPFTMTLTFSAKSRYQRGAGGH